MKNNKTTDMYCITKQCRMPVLFHEKLSITDPVLEFDRLISEIDLKEFISSEKGGIGCTHYNTVDLLKTVLFGFMNNGYCSLRELEDRCKVDIRYMYLMDGRTPTYKTFHNFINYCLKKNIEDLFNAVFKQINKRDNIDLNHLYIDGSKFEANANKYSWVWKKATESSRYRLFSKITNLFNEINIQLEPLAMHIETHTEYAPEYLNDIISGLRRTFNIDPDNLVSGKGHRKPLAQRQYELLVKYREKLNEYVIKLNICGKERNSYSKTDKSATFMRMKSDYMGNDQLLPAYNVQFGIADEYIAVVDVSHYRSDMDCFVPVIEKFKKIYGFYPKYPVADAGYGSYNNYLFCEQHGMEKFMKFPMFDKTIHDEKYANDPFRAVNFKTDEEGNMICPNNRKMQFAYKKPVKGNKYGREEEVYQCESCEGCPYADKCKSGNSNRTISLNRELSTFHAEVIENLESIHGALLRMNRSIQSEGTFGVIKQDRLYKRTVRRGIKSVELEIFLISIGFNLYKYYNKLMRKQKVA